MVFDFEDHHQNQTLKTGLILQWIQERCPIAQFLFKTDDDVVVNPWIMKLVVKENEDAKLVGELHYFVDQNIGAGHRWSSGGRNLTWEEWVVQQPAAR